MFMPSTSFSRHVGPIALMTALVLSATGCEPDPPWGEESDFDVEVASHDQGETIAIDGAGEDAFVIDMGFQGGQHFNVLVFAEGVPLDVDVNGRVFILDKDGTEVLNRQTVFYFDSYYSTGDTGWSYQQIQIENPEDFIDTDVTIRVQVVVGNEVGRGDSSAHVRWSENAQEILESGGLGETG